MNDLYRLSTSVYESLERQLPKPMVSKDTTEQQVGYLLGIQHVLGILRQGFTINDDDQARGVPLRTGKR